MLEVIRAKHSDIARIAPLVGLYWDFEEIAGFDITRIENNLATFLSHPERGTCWLAEIDGAIAGYLVVVYVFSLEHGGMMGEIDEFFVRPEYRSGGTGTALLVEAEAQMISVGLVQVQLQVALVNDRARSFYKRHGYRKRSGHELLEKPLSSVQARR